MDVDKVEDINSSNKCKVCGIENAHMYLGVLCCASCKMFFHRNANLDLNNSQCVFDGNCDITMNSRGSCRYCRFKKCLSVGLKKDLIRSCHAHKDRTQKRKRLNISNEKVVSLPHVIPTLDLLNNDRSLLTSDQWLLLSNVTHTYDENCPISTIRNTMALQLTYPTKIRLKMAIDYFKNLTGLLYLSAGPFIKRMPEFVNMSLDDKGILVERNIQSMSGFSGVLVIRETDLCTNPYYHNASLTNYGHDLTSQAMKIISHADIDGTLIKLMIPILALSTCSDILDTINNQFTHTTTTSGGTRFFSNTLHLLTIQNIYVEMMFKYMLYRYGYYQASLRFANLINTCLHQNLMVSGNGYLNEHHQMVQNITDQTERSLTLN